MRTFITWSSIVLDYFSTKFRKYLEFSFNHSSYTLDASSFIIGILSRIVHYSSLICLKYFKFQFWGKNLPNFLVKGLTKYFLKEAPSMFAKDNYFEACLLMHIFIYARYIFTITWWSLFLFFFKRFSFFFSVKLAKKMAENGLKICSKIPRKCVELYSKILKIMCTPLP